MRHVVLFVVQQARSQEARSNWETALESKDRAIDQLEEALASRQRALVRHGLSDTLQALA